VASDGSRVLFESNARNLVPDDSNLVRDVFLWTLGAQPALVRVNQPPGAQSNNVSFDPVLSRDGGRLVYQSFASNLVPGQLTGLEQPFRAPATGGVQQALLALPGTGAHSPRPSSDGQLTCVETTSSLDPLDGNGGIADVVLHDAATHAWLLQSRASSPQPLLEGNGASMQPDASPDGRFVAFHSLATTLDGASIDGNPLADVYWLDRDTGQIERHPVAAGGQPPNGASSGASVSADGRFLAFASTAGNLVVSDTDPRSDILRLDRLSGALIEVSAGLGAATGDSDQAQISDNGGTVVFRSADGNLVPGDGNAVADVFLWRQGEPLRRVSVSSSGAQADGPSLLPRLSADGEWLVFVSDAGNLVPDDQVGALRDVFRHHVGTGITQRISSAIGGGSSDGASHAADIAADGQAVAYVTSATDVATGDRPGPDVVVWQGAAGTVVNASRGLPAEYSVVAGAVRISDDGGQVLFQASHQVGSAFPHSLWRYDVGAATLSLAIGRIDGSAHLGAIDGFALDGTGSRAIFASTDGELVVGDHNGHADVFQVGLDSAAGSIGLLPETVTVAEGDCPVLLTVRRTGGSDGAVGVELATVSGSATGGLDFVAQSGTVSFAAGDTADRTVAIAIVDDHLVEPPETFTVVLGDPTGGVGLGPIAAATIGIVDDDGGDSIFGSGFEPVPVCPDGAGTRG
jgi:Tol biopolymer transport system component